MRLQILSFLVLFTALSVLTACSQNDGNNEASESTGASQPSGTGSAPGTLQPQRATSGSPAQSSAAVAGIQWNVPAGWNTQPARSMRVATYSIPAAEGDSENAECAVFFFGSGQGGDVESNIQRWIGQFETDSDPQRSSKTVNGMPVTIVSVTGTYLSPGGPMMQSQGKKPNYRLLGAIVEAPEGAVFFKTTGPIKTINAAESNFYTMLDSIRRTS